MGPLHDLPQLLQNSRYFLRCGATAVCSQTQNFGRDFLAAQGVAWIALRLINSAMEHATIAGVHRDLADPTSGIGSVNLSI